MNLTKIHKDLLSGTQISMKPYTLSIWGDKMAMVDFGGRFDDASSVYFNPELITRRYVVYLSNIPANAQLFGKRCEFQHGDKTFWEQPFSFRYGSEFHASRGQFEPPFDYWVKIRKLSDLGARQTQAVLTSLRDRGYVEASWRYPLPVRAWGRLLKMTYEATQDGDSDEANAVEDVLSRGAYNRLATTESTTVRYADIWSSIPGLYATTKKGGIRFIITCG